MSIFSRTKLVKDVPPYGRIVQQGMCRPNNHNFTAAIEELVQDRTLTVGRMCTKCGSAVYSRDLSAIAQQGSKK